MPTLPWKRAIVVGASSGMGEVIARRLAASGCKTALIARRESELNALRDALNAENEAPIAFAYPHDVAHTHEVNALFARITQDLGGLDLIVYASGVMPPVGPQEYDIEKDALMIEVNVTGAVAWLNEAAARFGKAKSGTIVGISSVAGDRGRTTGPVYGASKAFLNTYLEALRNRVARHGVKVVTVKPGPVKTPMTQGLGKLPFIISADEAADTILAAAALGVHTVYVPQKWRTIMAVIRAIPSPIFRYLNI
ncbi:short-chain dehydrogenase [Capsulimonas corticalis]|uniref:Short-chain dehydrogenase n=1 Tax=Capsulimonas corticalis TaxID=2219043 RepID=A0A402CXB3_9BACT|nr:SDR family NAD(P)-dependent oxidoreductase [Capsulimonas corticalis]BDI32376.1 short-chain dehydrogenase [Capsulimonas corticalis]